MQNPEIEVIAIDDDEVNLEIILKTLKNAKYKSTGFISGAKAWKYMQENPEQFNLAIIDKMMPEIDGITILKNMKAHPSLKNIPVIIQTGDVRLESMQSGIEAGAYYYLKKPFEPSTMISIVNSASKAYINHMEILKRLKKEIPLVQIMHEGSFKISDIKNAKKLALSLSNISKNPTSVAFALTELMVNSIEHGNLKIGYEKKNSLLLEKKLDEEINRRLLLDEYKDKFSLVTFKKDKQGYEVTITDQGTGFDWKKYIEFNPSRLQDCNGRGIATANLMDVTIDYQKNGNIVICRFE